MIEENLKSQSNLNKRTYIWKSIPIVATIFIFFFIGYALKLYIFEDKALLIQYIDKIGILAPIFFIFLQIIQVAIPIIPGGASCFAGVLAFGPTLGFLYNYIGLIIGSCLVFFLTKKYGLTLIRKLFKEETIHKYIKAIQTKKFLKLFLIGIIFPGFPDDLLCYIAGISSIKFKSFLLIILIGKPISLLGYSLFMKLYNF